MTTGRSARAGGERAHRLVEVAPAGGGGVVAVAAADALEGGVEGALDVEVQLGADGALEAGRVQVAGGVAEGAVLREGVEVLQRQRQLHPLQLPALRRGRAPARRPAQRICAESPFWMPVCLSKAGVCGRARPLCRAAGLGAAPRVGAAADVAPTGQASRAKRGACRCEA